MKKIQNVFNKVRESLAIEIAKTKEKSAEAKKVRAEKRMIRQGEKDLMRSLKAEQKEVQFNKNLEVYTISQHLKDSMNVRLKMLKVDFINLKQRMQDGLKQSCIKEIQDLEFTIQKLDKKSLVNAKEIGIAEDKINQLTKKWADYKTRMDNETEQAELKSEYVVRDEDYSDTMVAFLTNE